MKSDASHDESSLGLSAELLQLSMRACNIGLWDWDLQKNHISLSQEWKRQIGYEDHEIEDDISEWEKRIHPDDHAATMLKLRSCLDGKQSNYAAEYRLRHKDGSYRWIYAQGEVYRDADGHSVRMLGCHIDVTERRQAKEALEHRLATLTSPFNDTADIKFEDLFNLDEIQKIQDAFAESTGVASIITDTKGRPITRPSNFCHLCQNIIRKTEKGLANCYHSDEVLGRLKRDGAAVQPCLSGGLWDGGTSICVGDRHIANWLIGQVLDPATSNDSMMDYAREIGADEEAFREALTLVNRMPKEQFKKVCNALFLIAKQLSQLALQIAKQARHITESKRVEEERAIMARQLEGINILQESLLKSAALETKLTGITNGVVQYFNADFCRIWVIRPGDRCQSCMHSETIEGKIICSHRDKCLHLLASSGRYTHIDGKEHSRVPFGFYKIGRIASGDVHKFLIKDVANEPQVHNHEWARSLGLASFAGYQLRVPGRESIGVLALFSKQTILPSEDAMLDGLSSAIALTIQRAAAEEALHKAHDELEARVEQRTAELTQTNKTMQIEIAERQKAEEARLKAQAERDAVEVQLRQVQKLEAIGQLAAGIAHEINTPTQYVSDNTRFIQRSFKTIQETCTLYTEMLQAAKTNLITPELLKRIETATEAGELDYLFEEVPDAIDQTLEGVDRIVKIVRAMKDFSHPGSQEKASADLNRAIESTVTVTRAEWKYVADLKLNLDPNLPPVICFLGDFNQAVLNLIVNAAHAIGDVVKEKPETKGLITVSSRQDGDMVEVRISDTGYGIPEQIRPRIFDPFFTTKAVGKGTGQGLAVVYCSIVKRHGGTVAFETELGKGTTFIIRLPMAPS